MPIAVLCRLKEVMLTFLFRLVHAKVQKIAIRRPVKDKGRPAGRPLCVVLV